MGKFDIPENLVQLVRDRRVIPFVGAGFSATAGFPNWDQLLQQLVEDLDSPVGFDELQEATHGDPLQMAEYLFLHSDERIGPLRYAIEKQLPSNVNTVKHAAHLELLNLGAPQIYTTNYDELIESTFRQLRLPHTVIALAKDVALADSDRTQIVKYHGDLRHESTLVLTESSYYRRLDLESPMDLKFRSDLLGRSVLFMGYSFRDINIRVIWFKLMQMMEDVPAADRRDSYIVTLTPNPVLEKLYESVGLKTIVLDPERNAEDHSSLLGEFLFELSSDAQPDSMIPGGHASMFASVELLRRIEAELDAEDPDIFLPFTPTKQMKSLREFGTRVLPKDLRTTYRNFYHRSMKKFVKARMESPRDVADFVNFDGFAREFGATPELTFLITTGICSGYLRPAIVRRDWPWDSVWEQELGADMLKRILQLVEREVSAHEERRYIDEDLAYCLDIAARIRSRGLGADESLSLAASRLIDRAAEMYPSATAHVPDRSGPPDVEATVHEIGELTPPDHDVPF